MSQTDVSPSSHSSHVHVYTYSQTSFVTSPTDVGSSFSQSADNNIQRQQADLQAKILSLLGSSAVVPAAKPAPTHSPSTSGKASYPASRYGGGGSGVGGGRTEDTSYGDYSFADRYRQPAYGGYH